MDIEIVYTWPNGKEEVRYRRSKNTEAAKELIRQVDELKKRNGENCPYSYRTVK